MSLKVAVSRPKDTDEYLANTLAVCAGDSPSRVACPAVAAQEMPPALVVELRFSPCAAAGQPVEVVSAMNRSGSAMSSSIAHESSSNRARRARKSAISAELAESRGPASCQRYLPPRSRIRSRQAKCLPRLLISRSSDPRSASPRFTTVAKPPSEAARRKIAPTSTCVGSRSSLRPRPVRQRPSAGQRGRHGCGRREGARECLHPESRG